MSDRFRVEAEGLQGHAQVCDAAVSDLRAATPPTAVGHITQASTHAVALGHQLVEAAAAKLAARATSLGDKLRTVAGVSATVDDNGARSIAGSVEI